MDGTRKNIALLRPVPNSTGRRRAIFFPCSTSASVVMNLSSSLIKSIKVRLCFCFGVLHAQSLECKFCTDRMLSVIHSHSQYARSECNMKTGSRLSSDITLRFEHLIGGLARTGRLKLILVDFEVSDPT